MIITRTDLTNDIKYFGANIGDNLMMIGYCDVKHNDNLVAHCNLTQRSVEELRLQGLTADGIQSLGIDEANLFIASEECNRKIDDYIFAFNLGLYGNEVGGV